MQQNKHYGFSLIELMITLAIVGILAGIAYPSYQDSMTKSRRADAKAALLELSVFMERYYTANGCYTAGSCAAGTTTAPTLPFLVTPKSGKANYNLTVVTTPSSFTLTATPRKADGTSYSDTATDNPDTKCASLSLNNTNTKAESGTATVADCW
jgi:type IV pilus assembly protein PilE